MQTETKVTMANVLALAALSVILVIGFFVNKHKTPTAKTAIQVVNVAVIYDSGNLLFIEVPDHIRAKMSAEEVVTELERAQSEWEKSHPEEELRYAVSMPDNGEGKAPKGLLIRHSKRPPKTP